MSVLLWLRITSASASSGRSGGKDQRTPPRTDGLVVEMPPSRFIVRRRSIRSSPCTHARTHARHRRQLPYYAFVGALYSGESLMRQALTTVRTCIENGTSRIACRSKRHQEVRISSRYLFEILPRCIRDFFRFLLINVYMNALRNTHYFVDSKPIIKIERKKKRKSREFNILNNKCTPINI